MATLGPAKFSDGDLVDLGVGFFIFVFVLRALGSAWVPSGCLEAQRGCRLKIQL